MLKPFETDDNHFKVVCSFTSRRCPSAYWTPLNKEKLLYSFFFEYFIIIVKMVVAWETIGYKNADCFCCLLLCIHCIRAQKPTFLPQCDWCSFVHSEHSMYLFSVKHFIFFVLSSQSVLLLFFHTPFFSQVMFQSEHFIIKCGLIFTVLTSTVL